MRASELILKLQQLVAEHGDRFCAYPDNTSFGEWWIIDTVEKRDVRLSNDDTITAFALDFQD